MADFTDIFHQSLAFISFLIHSSLIFLILTKSPNQLGSYKYLMIFMSMIELGYSLIDVLIKPVIISTGSVWIVGTTLQRSSVPLKMAYPLVLLWGASFGIAVASFGVHFIFRYFMVIGYVIKDIQASKYSIESLPISEIENGFRDGYLCLFGSVY
uniref:7TM_GPCR_Srx domain-containing protein n=2 Tax=Caenorhabditis tropicalis TaxID=1561998 RepID=A0A1I7T6K3_9PELO